MTGLVFLNQASSMIGALPAGFQRDLKELIGTTDVVSDKRVSEANYNQMFDGNLQVVLNGQDLYISSTVNPGVRSLSETYAANEPTMGIDDYYSVIITLNEDILKKYLKFTSQTDGDNTVEALVDFKIPGIRTPVNGSEVGSYFYNYILEPGKQYPEINVKAKTAVSKKALAQLFCVAYLLKSGGFLTSLPFEEMFAMVKMGLRLSGRKERYPFFRLEGKKWVSDFPLYAKVPALNSSNLNSLYNTKKAFALNGMPGGSLHMQVDLSIQQKSDTLNADRNLVNMGTSMGTLSQYDWKSLKTINAVYGYNDRDNLPRGIVGTSHEDWDHIHPFGLYFNNGIFPFTMSDSRNALNCRERLIEETVFSLGTRISNIWHANSYVTTVYPEEVIIEKDVLSGLIYIRNCYAELGHANDNAYTRWFTIGGHLYEIKPNEVFIINPVAWTGFIDSSVISETGNFVNKTNFKNFNDRAVRPIFDYVYQTYDYVDVGQQMGIQGLPATEYGPSQLKGRPFQFQPLSVHRMRPDGCPDNAMLFKAYGIVNKGATAYFEITNKAENKISLINRYVGPSIGAILANDDNLKELASTVIPLGEANRRPQAKLDLRTGIWYQDTPNTERKVPHYLVKQSTRAAKGNHVYGITFQIPHVFQPYGGMYNVNAKSSMVYTLYRPLHILSVQLNENAREMKLPNNRGNFTTYVVQQQMADNTAVDTRFSINNGKVNSSLFKADSLKVSIPSYITKEDSFTVNPDLTINGRNLIYNESRLEDFTIKPLDRIESVNTQRMFTPWRLVNNELYVFKMPGGDYTPDFRAFGGATNEKAIKPSGMSRLPSTGYLPYPSAVGNFNKFKRVAGGTVAGTKTLINDNNVMYPTDNWANYPNILRAPLLHDVANTNAARETYVNKIDLIDPRRFSWLSKGFMTRGSKIVDSSRWPYRIMTSTQLLNKELTAKTVLTTQMMSEKYNKLNTVYDVEDAFTSGNEGIYQVFQRVPIIEMFGGRYGTSAQLFSHDKVRENNASSRSDLSLAFNEPLPVSAANERFIYYTVPTNGSRLINQNGDGYRVIYPIGENNLVNKIKTCTLEMGIGAQYLSCLIVRFDTVEKAVKSMCHLVFSPGLHQVHLEELSEKAFNKTEVIGGNLAVETTLAHMQFFRTSVATTNNYAGIESQRTIEYNGLNSTLYEEVENLILSNFGIPGAMSGVSTSEYSVQLDNRNYSYFPHNAKGVRAVIPNRQSRDHEIQYKQVRTTTRFEHADVVDVFQHDSSQENYDNLKRSADNYPGRHKWLVPTVMDDRFLGLTFPGQVLFNKTKGVFEEVFYLRDMFGPDEPVYIVKCVGNAKIIIEDEPAVNSATPLYTCKGRKELSAIYRVTATGDRAANYVYIRAFHHNTKTRAYEVKLYNGFRWLGKNLWGFNLAERVYGLSTSNKGLYEITNQNINVYSDLFAGIAPSLELTVDDWQCNHLGIPYLTLDEVRYASPQKAQSDKIIPFELPFNESVIDSSVTEQNASKAFGVPVRFKSTTNKGFSWNGGRLAGNYSEFASSLTGFFLNTKFFNAVSFPSAIDNNELTELASCPMHWTYKENKRVLVKEFNALSRFSVFRRVGAAGNVRRIELPKEISLTLLHRDELKRFDETEELENFYCGFTNPEFNYTAVYNYGVVESKLHLIHDYEIPRINLKGFVYNAALNFSLFNLVVSEGSEVFITINKTINVDLYVDEYTKNLVAFSLFHIEGGDATVYVQLAEGVTINVNIHSRPTSIKPYGYVVTADIYNHPGKTVKFVYIGEGVKVQSNDTDLKRMRTYLARVNRAFKS